VFTIARVVDGDTIKLTDSRTVRLVEIDTPETKQPSEPIECYGREASQRTAELLPPGEPVRLTYEQDREDRYGRTLAHVHRVRDGLWINAELVRGGYAQVMIYEPNNLYEPELRALQVEAQRAARGMWGACRAP
jgi:micrococcal nuclease